MRSEHGLRGATGGHVQTIRSAVLYVLIALAAVGLLGPLSWLAMQGIDAR